MHLLLELPEQARVWVFPLARPLSALAESALTREMEEIVTRWKAHGSAVQGGCEIAYHQFLIAAADEAQTQVSGCSIDSLVRNVTEAAIRAGAELADDSAVYFRDSEQKIIVVERDAFRALVAKEQVNLDTVVFNNTVLTLGDIRNGRWECAARDSWHARAFRFPKPGALTPSA